MTWTTSSAFSGKRPDSRLEKTRSSSPGSPIQIEAVKLHKLGTVKDLVQIVSKTKILLTTTGLGSATSIFLPQGSHLILFYDKWFVDWDYWNNMPHITVHWIPIEHVSATSGYSGDVTKYLEPLYQLIVDCLRN